MRHDLTKHELINRFRGKTLKAPLVLKQITYPLLEDMGYKELGILLSKVRVLPNGDLSFEERR